jgi:hypothetical protein
MSSTISLYVPRMSTAFNEERVRAVFDRLMIGQVTRVDFASINAGQHLSSGDRFQKAFIHLSHYYDTEAANHLRSSLKTTQDSVRVFPDLFSQQVYWIVLLNKNPVAETKLNIHQVVENHRILEQVVFQQVAVIQCLEAKLEQLIRYMNFPQELEDELLGKEREEEGEVDNNSMPELISMEDLNSA